MQTFAEYLINRILPSDIKVKKQIDKGYLSELLTEVARKHPDSYDEILTKLKRLADHISTMDALTIGLDEIDVPNKANRDKIIAKYQRLTDGVKDKVKLNTLLGDLQKELAKNDLDGTTDDASVMVRSALTGKKAQLMKMRTSPGVVGDHKGEIVPVIFDKSYAQGVDPLQFWVGATESRKNLAEGQVNTAKPGEFLKVMSNVMAMAVVSSRDCGTDQGILLSTHDDDIIDRYLAKKVLNFEKNTIITPDVQKTLLNSNIATILVRSPQTCKAPHGTVCQLCMGYRPGTGKDYEIGDNAGLITTGSLGEPMQQMTLSAKHSTTFAGTHVGLLGEKGFRQFVESPDNYPNRKVLCEVIGTVVHIRQAPQGGKVITVRQTKEVPTRYIEHGLKAKEGKGYWDYYIPPQLHIVKDVDIGTEVYPGMELSDGYDNLKDIARLRNLGYTRTKAAQNMYDIYKNTGMKMDRRHFELLARSAHKFVKIIKAPRGYDLLPGDTITYEELCQKVEKLPHRSVQTEQALGKVLAQGVLNLTVGTEIDEQTKQYLLANKISSVQICDNLEVAASVVPLTRVINKSEDWLASLNHRYLKQSIINAASLNRKSDVHGYNSVSAYAYGVEMGHGEGGRY